MKLKSDIFPGMNVLEMLAKLVAFIFGIALLVASSVELVKVFIGIWSMDVFQAIQEGLFILILLEMFYVVRSYIKYGSINVGLVVSVAIVAAVKELTFVLKTLTLEIGAAYALLFISMAIVYLVESRHYMNKKGDKILKSSEEIMK